MTADARIAEAARRLRAGELVAFPTETVYGLGADATNSAAVRRIFAAKGRPSSHPLIVHIGSSDELPALARRLPERAQLLAQRFWPGPLSIVVERADSVPLAVTGGQNTVAVRVPDHPVALALLAAFGGGVAAPSANRFGRLSPTTAEHVRSELRDAVDLVLDGGPCQVGIESTIVDLSRGRPVLLRAGGVAQRDLEEALGEPVEVESVSPVRAPGQLPSHYAPRAELLVVEAAALGARAEGLRQRGARVGLLLPEGVPAPEAAQTLRVPAESRGYARALYAGLRALDAAGVDVTLVVAPEATGIGAAVADRLRRASAPRPPEDCERASAGETAATLRNSG